MNLENTGGGGVWGMILVGRHKELQMLTALVYKKWNEMLTAQLLQHFVTLVGGCFHPNSIQLYNACVLNKKHVKQSKTHSVRSGSIKISTPKYNFNKEHREFRQWPG